MADQLCSRLQSGVGGCNSLSWLGYFYDVKSTTEITYPKERKCLGRIHSIIYILSDLFYRIQCLLISVQAMTS